MARRYYANSAPQQTLASSITAGALSCTVSGSFAGWPVQFPFYAALDKGTASFELVSVTNIVGTTATIVRGQDGTSAISHPAGATIDQVIVRQDLDEANAHVNASTGVHGVSGSVVGTSDAQTLSNKTITGGTLNSPTINTPTISGAASSNAVNTGDGTHSALTGKATTAGGKTLSLQNSSAVEKLGVDDAGNVTASGNITASGGLITGKTVTGGLIPTTFTNEAAASAAIASPTTNTIVWLTAPTGGAPAGPYYWNGTVWAPVRSWNGGDSNLLGNSAALATAGTAIATPGSVTFTLPSQSLVRIDAIAQFEMLTGTTGRYYVRPAYNSGASVVIGSAIGIGFFATTMVTVTGTNGMTTATAWGTVTLSAGQYTAYGLLARAAGGGATDIAQTSEVLVTVTPL